MTIVEEIRQDPQRGAKRLDSEYRAGLTTLARRICHDDSDAAELVNRTFAAVVEGIDGFLEQSAFFGWMCQILTSHHSRNIRRKSAQDIVYPGILPDAIDEKAQDAIYDNLDAALLRKAIDELPKEQRDAIALHYFMDMSVVQIAKYLAVPTGTVMSRLHYARKALAAKMGAKAEEIAKKPGGKAVLLALLLCGLTALGAAITATVNQPPNLQPSTSQPSLGTEEPITTRRRTAAAPSDSSWSPTDHLARSVSRHMFNPAVGIARRGCPHCGMILRSMRSLCIRAAAVLAAACPMCLADLEPAAVTGKIRYVVTDFTFGDRFSSGPQMFFLRDSSPAGGHAVESGAIRVDLTERDEAVLNKEIPVWGQPERWILTVEAPPEAAGIEFRALYQTGGKNCHGVFGRLANDSNHETQEAHEKSAELNDARMVAGGWLRQTFEIGGITQDDAWRTGDGKRIEEIKNADLPSRLIQFSVLRGGAAAGRYDIRLVSLEAVCEPNVGAPPLMPVPPGGNAPPETLDVQCLNFTGRMLANAEVRVKMASWDGAELGTAGGELPPTAPGERAIARIALPKAPKGLNFVSYTCELFSGGQPDSRVGKGVMNWTRPLPDGGSPELSPDSPWGFGVYLHRTADFTSFQNAYAPVKVEESFANMEKRAALAQAVGVKWERVEFLQYAFAKGKGRYDFSFYDRLCEIAERHGLSPLGMFSHFWPAGSPAFTPQGYDDQVEAFRALATRYRGRIRHWELWNEPWGAWSGPMEDYFKLVDRMFDIAKEIDPENTVIACSAVGLDPKTINAKFLEAEKAPDARFDALSIHPYRGEPAEDGVLADIAAVAEKSPCGRVWITEIGWPTCGKWVYRETDQAAYFARFLMTAVGSGKVHSVYGYDLVDDGFNPLERENSFGLVRRDFTPKPACRAVAKVYRTFTHGTPQLERQDVKDGAVVWVFRMGGKSAVWANRDQRLSITADRPTRFSNLMDETLDESATAFRGVAGPRNLVFIDGDVVSVKAEGTP